MDDHAVAELVKPILERQLRVSGLQGIAITPGHDLDGLPTLVLHTYFAGRGHPVDTRALLDAVTEARLAVARAGETRFLRLQFHIPDAEAPAAA